MPSDRQQKIINRLLDGCDGKLSSPKWGKINQCPQDTALRDIQDLIMKGVFKKEASGGRSTNYELSKLPAEVFRLRKAFESDPSRCCGSGFRLRSSTSHVVCHVRLKKTPPPPGKPCQFAGLRGWHRRAGAVCFPKNGRYAAGGGRRVYPRNTGSGAAAGNEIPHVCPCG